MLADLERRQLPGPYEESYDLATELLQAERRTAPASVGLGELLAARYPAVRELAEAVGTLAAAYLTFCEHLCTAVRAFWKRHREVLVGRGRRGAKHVYPRGAAPSQG